MHLKKSFFKYMRYKALKKLYFCQWQDDNREFYKESVTNRFFCPLEINFFHKADFKKFLKNLKYFLKKKKALYLNLRKWRWKDLTCITQVKYTTGRPVFDIQFISGCYFNNEYYQCGRVLYCKDFQSIIMEFAKGMVTFEDFMNPSKDITPINFQESKNMILIEQIKRLRREARWTDVPLNRRYIEQWCMKRFFMPYERKKSYRRRILLKVSGPIYPENTMKLEDYYKYHKDSRPKLNF